jgi:hypothetical protein
MPSNRLILAFLTSLAFALPAVADTVTLKDGTVLEGRVVETKDTVEVYTKGQRRILPRSKVKTVATKATRYQAKRDALDPKRLRDCLALAKWCDSQRLRKNAREVRKLLLKHHPNHAPTRSLLGYVRHEGRWITRDQYMESLNLVKSRDGKSWVSHGKRQRQDLSAEHAALQPEVEAILRSTARRGPKPVLADLAKYPTGAVVGPLARVLRGSETKALRKLAAEELGRRRAKAAEAALARSAVEDTSHTVRTAALGALKHVGSTRMRREFVRGLSHKSVFKKAHAAEALAQFPYRGAVPVLIHKLRETTSGFGVVSITIKTDRAYISDYELSSGGTGAAVAEVADPTVSKSTEGVSLEVKIVQWYRETLVKALRRATGQSFGSSAKQWDRWWKKNRPAEKK